MSDSNRRQVEGRDEKTGRFLAGNSGNGGRPKGSRNKLATEFIDALYADFQVNGADAIKKVAAEDPAKYLQLIAQVLPKELDIALNVNHDLLAEVRDFRAAYDLALRTIGADEIDATAPLLIEAEDGAQRNQALALAVALLAENTERVTERSWREDSFTTETLFRALVVLIAHFAPKLEKPIPVPPAVEAHAAKMPTPEDAEQFRNPKGLAGLLAYSLYKEIKDASPSEINEWTMPIFFSASRESLGLIARDLGIAGGKKEKSK